MGSESAEPLSQNEATMNWIPFGIYVTFFSTMYLKFQCHSAYSYILLVNYNIFFLLFVAGICCLKKKEYFPEAKERRNPYSCHVGDWKPPF